MALSSQHMLDALRARRTALTSAAGVAQGAAGATGGMRASEPTNFAQMFGQLAQQYAMQQTMRQSQGGPGSGGGPNAGGGGSAPPGTQTGFMQSSAPGAARPFDPLGLSGPATKMVRPRQGYG